MEEARVFYSYSLLRPFQTFNKLHSGDGMNTKTKRQKVGQKGEDFIVKNMDCPQCKRSGTLKCLPANFKCADIICDFCGFLAQVKTKTVKNIEKIPNSIPGAAWGPQKERMDAGIYFPLFIVLKTDTRRSSIFYLPVDYQDREIFVPRKKLSESARRAGWQGYNFDLTKLTDEGVIRRLL